MKKGFKHSEETRKKIKEARKKQDEKYGFTPHWKGGISIQHKKRMTELQYPKPDRCEICNRGGELMWDHDHKTGKFRGWLCHYCNSSLGFAGDSVEILQKMIEYLKR